MQITGRWCRFFCSIDRVGQKCHVYDKSLRSNHSSYSKPVWFVVVASFVAQEVTNRRETSIDQVRQKCQVSSCHISSFQLLLFETVWYGGIQPSSLFPKSNGTTRMQQSFLPIHDPWDFVMLWRSTPCSITTATLSRAVATHDNGWCTKFFRYNRGGAGGSALTFTASVQSCDRK